MKGCWSAAGPLNVEQEVSICDNVYDGAELGCVCFCKPATLSFVFRSSQLASPKEVAASQNTMLWE